MKERMSGLLAVGIVFALASSAASADDAGVRCEQKKIVALARYNMCRARIDARAATPGTVTTGALRLEGNTIQHAVVTDYAECDSFIDEKFTSAEDRAGVGLCPSEGDTAAIKAFQDACAAGTAVALNGGGLLLDPITCNEDLAKCEDDLSSWQNYSAICSTERDTNRQHLDTCYTQLGQQGEALTTCHGDLSTTNTDLGICNAHLANGQPQGKVSKTGQTTCYDEASLEVTSCAGSGQDGETQSGLARSFTDNGNGTITDNNTGLVWEKLSDDDSIHDWENRYHWPDRFLYQQSLSKLAVLNGENFAGHNDWRTPNINELVTLTNYGAHGPAAYPEFHTGCVPGCTVTTCSCMVGNFVSSTTRHGSPDEFFYVHSWNGDAIRGSKISDLAEAGWSFRAVRGGT